MKLFRLLLCIPALIFVLFMRLVWPIWKIKLGVLYSNRIGHLAGNTEVYLLEKDTEENPSTDLWCHFGVICNKQLAKMISRVMHVDPTGFVSIIILCNNLFDNGHRHIIGTGTLDRDVSNLQDKYGPHFSFTPDEIEQGESRLRRMGIPEEAKWVCLIVRDKAYIPELDYHSFRDSHIETYMEAAIELASRGYYVIRMGAKVEKALPFANGRIIDYATNGMRSDFMDIYLMAHCAFCVSTGTGLDAVAVAFRRPVCYVNYTPIEYLMSFNRGSLAIWKHYERDGKRLGLREIYDSGASDALHADTFKAKGITLVDNTPEEIRDVVAEMADRMPTAIASTVISTDSQEWFWKDFPRNNDQWTKKPLHGDVRMRIGTKFLQGYQSLTEQTNTPPTPQQLGKCQPVSGAMENASSQMASVRAVG